MTDERAKRMAERISKAIDSAPTPEIKALRVIQALVDDHNESIEVLAKSLGAMTAVLVDKGIVSHDELDHARIALTGMIDQTAAKQLDDFLAELDADDPDIQELINKLRENGL